MVQTPVPQVAHTNDRPSSPPPPLPVTAPSVPPLSSTPPSSYRPRVVIFVVVLGLALGERPASGEYECCAGGTTPPALLASVERERERRGS